MVATRRKTNLTIFLHHRLTNCKYSHSKHFQVALEIAAERGTQHTLLKNTEFIRETMDFATSILILNL